MATDKILIKIGLGLVMAFFGFWSYPIIDSYAQLIDFPGEILTVLVMVPALVAMVLLI
jgi:hypothetical protein